MMEAQDSRIGTEWQSLASGNEPLDIASCVRRAAAEKPDAPAVLTLDGSLTWAALDRQADALAAALAARGLPPGARLGWLGRNGLDYPIVLLAALRARLTLVGLNWRLSAAELAGVVSRCAPALTIADKEFRHLLPADTPMVETGAELDALIAAGGPPVASEPQPDDLTTLFFTSGTTGEPKAYAYTRQSVEDMIFAPTTLAFTPDARLLIVAPVFHTAGWAWSLYAFAGGMTQVQLASPTPAAMLDATEKLGVTHAQWVPTVLSMLLEEQKHRPTIADTLRMVAYGTSPIAESLLDACLETFGCDFTQVYGLTETIGPISHLPPWAHRERGTGRSQATGLPNPRFELRIVDEAGQPLPAGELGEILIHMPYQAALRWESNGDTSPVTDADGWIHTGDVGRLDAEGFLSVTDRKKDMIITGGENVFPVEVENILAGLPGVGEVAVFGLPHPKWGDCVVAAIIPRAGETLDPQAVIAGCRERLAHYKCPTRIFETDQLPRNASGKVLRRMLPELFG